MKGFEDIVIVMMECYVFILEGYFNLKCLSYVFNFLYISKDVEIILDFFVNKLGFKVYMYVNSMD